MGGVVPCNGNECISCQVNRNQVGQLVTSTVHRLYKPAANLHRHVLEETGIQSTAGTTVLLHLTAVFTARCTIVQSAVLRSHVVCLSICPSVTLVDHDYIG